MRDNGEIKPKPRAVTLLSSPRSESVDGINTFGRAKLSPIPSTHAVMEGINTDQSFDQMKASSFPVLNRARRQNPFHHQMSTVSSTQQLSATSPSTKQLSALTPPAPAPGVPSTQQLGGVPSTQQLSGVPPMQQLSGVPPMQQLSGVPPVQQLPTQTPRFTLGQYSRSGSAAAPSQASSKAPTPKAPTPKAPTPTSSFTSQGPYTGPQHSTSMTLGVGAPGSFAPVLHGAGTGNSNGVQDNKAQASTQPRDRRNSTGATRNKLVNSESSKSTADLNRENSPVRGKGKGKGKSKEEAPQGNSLQDPHIMGMAPKDETQENKLSKSAVNLQHKLARLAAHDRRVL